MTDILSVEMPVVPLMALSTQAQDETIGRTHGVRAFLKQPFQEQQFLLIVAQFAPAHE
jgi:hypothetical protein